MEQEVQNVEPETTTTETVEKNSGEKMFTQKEVDDFVKIRLRNLKEGMPSEEELTKYNEWKESQKTQQDKYDELVQKDNEKSTTISNLQKENLILKSGITDSDEVEFIAYKVGKMEGDFEENLKNYLAENPKYTQSSKATGVETKSSSIAKEDGVLAILKAKHPDIDF